MADSTKMPSLAYFQWSRPGAPNPRLAAPIDSGDTTLVFTSAPQDEDGNVITSAFLMGVKNSSSYVETIYVPAGALSVDGLTATGVVRGIDISGIDYTTGDASFASSFDQDSPVFCNVTAVMASIVRNVLQGTGDMATGGLNFVIGDETDSTVTIKRAKSGSVEGFLRLDNATGKVQFQNSPAGGWVDIDDNSAGNLTLISANDTTPGYANGKLVAGANVTLTENNDGGNETLTIAATSANETVTTHATYTPAYLTGGNAPETTIAIWDSVSDGEFAITIDGVAREITGLDFTTPVTTMADVAAIIQAGIRSVTSSTETCTWSGTEFVITSADTTASSAITKTSTVAAPAGTDISGAGAGAYMDCDAGSTAAVTNKVLDPTADTGKVPALNANGNVDTDLLQEVIPTGGYTAKGEIIAATAADTPGLLTVGSDGQMLVADSGEATGLNWSTPTTDFIGIGSSASKTYLQYVVNDFSNTDIWTLAAAGTPTRTYYPGGVTVSGTGTNGAYTWVTANGISFLDASGPMQWNDTWTTIVCEFTAVYNATAITDGNFGMGFMVGASAAGNFTSATNKVAFGVDSSGDLYARCGTNATTTTEQITGITLTDRNVFRIEYERAVEARFYVNGTLESTLNTNMPTSATDVDFGFGINEQTGTAAMSFGFATIGIEF